MRKYLQLKLSCCSTEALPLGLKLISNMAKEVTKKTVAVAKKIVAAPKKTANGKAPVNIVKVAEAVLEKLKTLHLEPSLQSDIVWCLGSYGHDQNPVGLFENAGKALVVFKAELAKRTKGITAKFVSDIEKALEA